MTFWKDSLIIHIITLLLIILLVFIIVLLNAFLKQIILFCQFFIFSNKQFHGSQLMSDIAFFKVDQAFSDLGKGLVTTKSRVVSKGFGETFSNSFHLLHDKMHGSFSGVKSFLEFSEMFVGCKKINNFGLIL